MAYDALSIYTAFLGTYSICFTFLPIGLILEWKKRGTADGFSSVNFVLPLMITSFWLRHGYMTNDQTNITINTISIGAFILYIAAFAYYQPKRQYVIGQVIAVLIIIFVMFSFVDNQDPAVAADVMGTVAAGSQIFGLCGGIYEIKRAISMGTTEYIPAVFQYLLFTLIGQWLFFGFITGNYYIVAANAAGLLVNIATISLYFFYPPLTWKVPFIGTGPQQKPKEN